ncbi:hypothetical protein GH733_000903 [Mirounga leonina]|nr:hypothetical protein GH733_000903 [Mirounga leonina]
MMGVFFPLPTAPSTGPWNVCRTHEGAGSCLLGNCGCPAREHPQAQDSDVGQEGSRARLREESLSDVKMQIIIPAQSDQGNRSEVSNTATKETTAAFPVTHMSGQLCLGKPSLLKPRLALLTVASVLHPQGLGPPAMPMEFKRNQAAKIDELQITIRPN